MSDFNDSEDSDPTPTTPIPYPDIMGIPVIHLKECVLYAPSPNGPPPTTRDKPLGCKTVFVGGLPENATEEMMRELFGMVGDISTIRMSLKNFCHIRFCSELFVDRAIGFSGYRMKINDKDDAPNTGRLHVDYAQARDDQFEYQCRQRTLEADQEGEENSFRPPTPPAITPYSDQEAIALSAKLRDDDTFQGANSILIAWLERGVCTKKNASFFFSMLQSTVSHTHRLRNEKIKYENLLSQAKFQLQDEMRNILLQFEEIGKVFVAANVQKVWDHFTKPQRRNILTWKEDLELIKTEHSKEIIGERVEDDMDLSESEDDEKINKSEEAPDANNETVSVSEMERLQEENDTLRCQLSASENEVSLARMMLEADRADKDKQIKLMCENMQNVYKNFLSEPEKIPDDNVESSTTKSKRSYDVYSESSCDSMQECSSSSNVVTSSSGSSFSISEVEARYLGLVSTFLCAHPFGANIDYICSYLNEFNCTIHARDLELLLEKFPIVFRKRSTGIGARLEKKWSFCGFET